jgi:hypothetical protein
VVTKGESCCGTHLPPCMSPNFSFTVGDLHAFLISELRRLRHHDSDESRIFERLREII